MSNHRPVRADAQALSGLLRQFDNQLKEQGRVEERGIVLDALQRLEASPASLGNASFDAMIHQRPTSISSTKADKISAV